MEQVKLWITNEDRSVVPLSIRDHIEYEQRLEDMLVARPDMLGDGVTLVGRQMRTAGGPLDLLGIDEDGKLVVYELKRGKTPREALTQAIDYASWLDTLEYQELARLISDHEPKDVEREFGDFDDWYTDHFDEDQVERLRPTRIVQVGLGLDSDTERMAQWLSDKGVDIQAINFLAYADNGRTILARQVEVTSDDAERTSAKPSSRNPYHRAAEFGAEEVLRTAYQIVDSCFAGTFAGTERKTHNHKNGFNFALPPTDDREFRRFPGFIGVFVRTGSEGQINLFARPAALAACPEECEAFREEARRCGASIRQNAQMGIEIGVDASQLESLKPKLKVFANATIAAWQRAWDEWNTGSSADEPAATAPEGNES